MGGMGPPPSANSRRRNKVYTEHLNPSGDIDVRSTKLRNRSSYCAFTQYWFDVWASSPQSEAFEETDWLRLQMIAPLVERLMTNPNAASQLLLAEIRQNESLLGGTVMDRMRLRMGKKDEDRDPDELPEDVADFMAHMDKKRG